jgi:hypothetical protein
VPAAQDEEGEGAGTVVVTPEPPEMATGAAGAAGAAAQV